MKNIYKLDMKHLNKEKLVIPLVIFLSSLVLGGAFFASQVSKQRSIEKQLELKLEQEMAIENAKLEQGMTLENAKLARERADVAMRQACSNDAEENAMSLLKNKAGLQGGWIYNEAVNKGLFLTDDFDSHYESCLSRHGLKR